MFPTQIYSWVCRNLTEDFRQKKKCNEIENRNETRKRKIGNITYVG